MAKSDTGSGNVWFKVYQLGQMNTYTGYDYTQVQWASPNALLNGGGTISFDIPADIAPGSYLLRSTFDFY
jgi:hypothetical protein